MLSKTQDAKDSSLKTSYRAPEKGAVLTRSCVAAGRDWEIGYNAAAEGLDILSFDDAITWVNHLITAIDSSRDS